MEKEKMSATKKAKVLLVIAIALMLVSGIVVSAIQTHFGKVTMKELTLETDTGFAMSAYLFVPDSATEENKAPAIVTMHGYLNNKEMTDANYVELARRGYVVLAVDMQNHGNSEVIAEFNQLAPGGIYEGALAVSRMPFVDTDRIGVTGHSMGSWSCHAAIKADNDADTQVISAALIHCNDPEITDADGNYVDIYGDRSVGVIAAVYDDFFNKHQDDAGNTLDSPYFMESATAQSFLHFSSDPAGLEERKADTYYTETVDGKDAFRVIYRPAVSHAWSHFSARSEAYVIDFFEEAFGAPNPIDADNQIWQWKEAFNCVGLIGFFLFICAFGACLLSTPFFERLRAKEAVIPAEPADGKGKIWFWGSLAACLVFSTVSFLPVMAKGSVLPVSQVMIMGMGIWSIVCGVFTILVMLLYYRSYGKKQGMDLEQAGVKISLRKLGLSVLLAFIVIIVSYGCVFAADYFFQSDFRIWTLAVKAFNASALKQIPYILLFLTFYIATSVSVNCFLYNTIGKKANGIICAAFTAAPALILPLIQYGTYFTQKHLMWAQPVGVRGSAANYPMYIIGLFPLIALLFVTTLISRYFYQRTKNPYIAGIINAIIIGLFAITNTCTTII